MMMIMIRMEIQMKTAFFWITNISETKIGAKKKCINGMEQMA